MKKTFIAGLTLLAMTSSALSDDCANTGDEILGFEAQKNLSVLDEQLLARVIEQIEVQFNKQGIQFDAGPNRNRIIRELEQLFTYYTAENDPGASKRMAYLVSLFKYARFKRVSGTQLRQLISDIGEVVTREKINTELQGEAAKAEGIFDMNQIMAVTDYFEMENKAGAVTLLFKTNCKAGNCRININTNALNEATKKRMKGHGVELSHIEYQGTMRMTIISGDEIKARAAELSTLILKKSSPSIHQMTPVAPPYVADKFTRPENIEDDLGRQVSAKVVRIEERIGAYVDAVSKSRTDFTPLLIQLDGFAIKAKLDKRQAGLGGMPLSSNRTIRVDSFAILPQFLGRDNAYSPVIFGAHDKIWGAREFSIKIAR